VRVHAIVLSRHHEQRLGTVLVYVRSEWSAKNPETSVDGSAFAKRSPTVKALGSKANRGLCGTLDKVCGSPQDLLYCITEPPGQFFEPVGGGLGARMIPASRQRFAKSYDVVGTPWRSSGVSASKLRAIVAKSYGSASQLGEMCLPFT